MKNRSHDKKSGIAILVVLIIITLAEMVFRAVVLGKGVLDTSNAGEQVAVIVIALSILFMTLRGKDRISYILYGAWLGFFVFDQLFELPSVLLDVIVITRNGSGFIALSPAFHVISMFCIIAIGILLVEYMNDGSIYNRAFNTLCVIAILSILGSIIINILTIVNGMDIKVLLATFNNLYRLVMIFLFTFFAYDSAKKQLNKVDFGSTK